MSKKNGKQSKFHHALHPTHEYKHIVDDIIKLVTLKLKLTNMTFA